MQTYYKYQYRLNASHSRDNQEEHRHTFTITLYVSAIEQTKQIMFYDIDKVVHTYLKTYEYTYLNQQPAFVGKSADLEDIGDVFYEGLKQYLQEIHVRLYQLDICENPLRVYEVSERLHIPACYIH